MDREEPIVAGYRNTYDVAVGRALSEHEVFVQRGPWWRRAQIAWLLVVTVGTIVAIVLTYVYPVFSRPVTPAEKGMSVLCPLAIVFLWFQTTKGGRRSLCRAITRLGFRWSRSSNKSVILTIDNEAIVAHVEGEDGRYYQMWRGLEKVARTPDGFVLWIPKHWSMSWMPLEAFRSEQDVERFAQLARSNVREYVERVEE